MFLTAEEKTKMDNELSFLFLNASRYIWPAPVVFTKSAGHDWFTFRVCPKSGRNIWLNAEVCPKLDPEPLCDVHHQKNKSVPTLDSIFPKAELKKGNVHNNTYQKKLFFNFSNKHNRIHQPKRGY